MNKLKILWVVWYSNGSKSLEFMTSEEQERLFPIEWEEIMAVWPATEKDVVLRPEEELEETC